MCWQVYAAVGMKALGLWQENKARAQVAKSQAEDATLSMNYQLMNYEQARADAYDEVVGEIIKTRQNSMQPNRLSSYGKSMCWWRRTWNENCRKRI